MPKPYKPLTPIFPFEGLNTNWAFDKQPPTSSISLLNVRPYDVVEERARGGKRPGLVRAYEPQVSDDAHPVIAIAQIVTTYIEPE